MSPHRVALLSLLLLGGSAAGQPAWRTVQRTAAGRSLVEEKTGLTAVPAALRAGLQDLAPVLGTKPTVHRAWTDARDPRQGGLSFTATWGGLAVKGLLTCRLGQPTRLGAVVVRADAPASAWQALLQPGAAGPTAPGPSPAGRTLVFPDGTGRMVLPPGWSTDARTAMAPVVVKGPGDQLVLSGVFLTIQLPTAPFRPPGALVAPFGTPQEVFAAISPQLSQASLRAGGPGHALDHLATVEQKQAAAPGGRAAVVSFGLTETRGGQSRHYRSLAQLELVPLTGAAFLLSAVQVRAPDATYRQDLPVMLGILGSIELNDAVVRQKGAERVAAQKRWFAGQQAAHRAQVEAFDAHTRQWEANQRAFDARTRDQEASQLSRARSNDDFDEVIRGYRTVEDTRTGEKTVVDLGNVDKVVEELNRADPERYRQLPLRDEADPLP